MNIALPILNLIVLGAICFFLWRKEEGALRRLFWPAVLFKFLGGISVGLVYFYHYKVGDTLSYFNDGEIIATFARENPGAYFNFLWRSDTLPIQPLLYYIEERAMFFVKFVSFLNLVSGGNYWISSLYCSLISFFGAWTFFKAIDKYLSVGRWPFFLSFMLLPSVVFWSAGMIKESLACGALFYISALFVQMWFDEPPPIHKSILGVIALWLLWSLKYYYAAVFLLVVTTFLGYRFLVAPLITNRSLLIRFFWLAAIFVVPLVLISLTHPNFYYDTFLEVIVSNNGAYAELSAPEDIIHYASLKPTVGSVLMNAPLALFSGLFRPLIFEQHNGLQLIAAVENLLILLITLWVLIALRKFSIEPHIILVMAGLLYVFLLCVFLALSTPNFGTLSRYRVGYLPYFLFILLCHRAFTNFFQRLSFRLFGRQW